jgi:hypothetical protein
MVCFCPAERDSFRYAHAHLRSYSPNLVSYRQLNRRIRALEPELRAFQRELAKTLADGSEVYQVLDTALVPAIVRVRACRILTVANSLPRLSSSTGLSTR